MGRSRQTFLHIAYLIIKIHFRFQIQIQLVIFICYTPTFNSVVYTLCYCFPEAWTVLRQIKIPDRKKSTILRQLFDLDWILVTVYAAVTTQLHSFVQYCYFVVAS